MACQSLNDDCRAIAARFAKSPIPDVVDTIAPGR
jgi:hypothetical protein